MIRGGSARVAATQRIEKGKSGLQRDLKKSKVVGFACSVTVYNGVLIPSGSRRLGNGAVAFW